ncbi:MAG TPA: hypothetical protein VIY86_13970, partial [Pirellulaceae bacterium]
MRAMPAWLTSFLMHLLLMLLLALMTLQIRHRDPEITLGLEVSREDRAGDREALFSLDQERFDLPLPEAARRRPHDRQALIRANQDARAIRLDPDAEVPELPSLRRVLDEANSPDVDRRALIFRDPRLRVRLVRQEGGTVLTEAAVARGLRWLARQQRSDG